MAELCAGGESRDRSCIAAFPRRLISATQTPFCCPSEKRKDAQLAREVEFAIPREMTQDQGIALARAFVQREFVDRGMVADLNVHWDIGADGEANPMQRIPHFVAGIDYLIASDDPADQALATEYRTQSWTMRELVEAIAAEMTAGQIAGGWLEKMETQRRICDDLTTRVFEWAQALLAAGASPADELTVAKDWRARANGLQFIQCLENVDEVILPSTKN